MLSGITLSIEPGQVFAVLGRNGAGKTTLINTVMGLLRPHAGQILVGGTDLTGAPPWRVARHGVALVPQGRRVFAPLTVAEHLAIAGRRRRNGPWTRDTVLDLLPALRRRLGHRGGQLSGGEQQMLALARALLTNPGVLLLDEPAEGLAPALADQVAATIASLARAGTAIMIAEQSSAAARADDAIILNGACGAERLERPGLAVPPDPAVRLFVPELRDYPAGRRWPAR